jgi:hypothetical protein
MININDNGRDIALLKNEGMEVLIYERSYGY